MSFLAPDHPLYDATYGGAIDRMADPEITDCPHCGQLMIATATVCGTCRAADRLPQGQALALFTTPAAASAPQEGSLF
jgi:hypothetical protein